MGFFERLFGIGKEDPARRSVEEGQTCAKCGRPVPRDNMGFDTGSGRPVHLTCPAAESPTE